MKNNSFNRNQFMMTSLDEMISEDSKVRVIDASIRGRHIRSADLFILLMWNDLDIKFTQTELDVPHIILRI